MSAHLHVQKQKICTKKNSTSSFHMLKLIGTEIFTKNTHFEVGYKLNKYKNSKGMSMRVVFLEV